MLILKNEVKEEFDKVGLSNLTVARSEGGYLYIVGPCGKKIVQVTDFPVRSKLAKKEREIAIKDYIVPVLNANEADIKDYIKAEEEKSKKLEIYEKEKELILTTHDEIKSLSIDTDYKSYHDRTIIGYSLTCHAEIDNIYIKYNLKKDLYNKYKNYISIDKVEDTNKLIDIKDYIDSNKFTFEMLIDKYIDYVNASNDAYKAKDKLRISCNL